MPRITGNGVILREWQTQDDEMVREWMNDAETVRWLGSAFWGAKTEQDAENFCRARMESSYNAYYFVIAHKDSERYLGHIDLLGINWRMRQAQLAIVIGQKQNRGRGYGTQALQAVKQFAFQTLGLERLELEVMQENQAAIRAYQKAGFAVEGIKRHAYFCEGSFHNQVLMSCLAGE